MAKQVKQYIKNPKYGQPGEPERILIPQMVSENGAFLNRMAQIEKLEYNATQVTGNNYNGLAEALASVTNDKYKVKGIVLTWFDSTENQWKSMRYNGADSTGWAEVSNWVNAGGDTGDTQYLDLSMFSEESGTLSEEDYQKVVKAYEDKVAIGINYMGMLNGNINIIYSSDSYRISFNVITKNTDNNFIISLLLFTVKTDKSYLGDQDLQPYEFIKSGSGTKFLSDNGEYKEISAGTQYLDLSMFTSESGTLSEENYQKVVKAYEDGVNTVLYNESLFSSIFLNSEGNIMINIYFISTSEEPTDVIFSCAYITLNSDKTYNSRLDLLASFFNLQKSGKGTKALTDNGQYAEFASPIKTQDGGTGAITKELQSNTYYKFGECSSLTITLATEKSGILNEYMFEFVSGATPTTLTDIPNIKWQNGEKLVPEANCTYQVSIVNNCAVYAKFPNA